MAGASIRIDYDFDNSEVRAALDNLIRAGTNMEPAFHEIGEYLKISHRERWENEESPDGTPWEPLDPKYQARKKKNADKILVLEGFMRDLLSYNASASGLEFGTNQIYGATHHFGDPDRGIPERPFLGLSDGDEAEVLAILRDHLAAAIGI